MPILPHPDLTTTDLALAYIYDAHNIGCLVRAMGEQRVQVAHYSAAIQESGVVIRACHVVVVDRSRDPLEVIWRIGTRGTIERVDSGHLTLQLGYSELTIPLRDERPAEEWDTPLAVGDTVLVRGSPIEEAAVVDLLVAGELAHPERLQARLAHVVERLRPH